MFNDVEHTRLGSSTYGWSKCIEGRERKVEKGWGRRARKCCKNRISERESGRGLNPTTSMKWVLYPKESGWC